MNGVTNDLYMSERLIIHLIKEFSNTYKKVQNGVLPMEISLFDLEK